MKRSKNFNMALIFFRKKKKLGVFVLYYVEIIIIICVRICERIFAFL